MAQAALTIEISGIKELLSATGKAKTVIDKEIQKAVDNSALGIQRLAKKEVPVDTGRLQKSIDIVPSFERLSAAVAATAKYAPFVEFGTPVGTGPHGGPKPFMRNAAESAVSGIEQQFKDAADRIAKQLET